MKQVCHKGFEMLIAENKSVAKIFMYLQPRKYLVNIKTFFFRKILTVPLRDHFFFNSRCERKLPSLQLNASRQKER